MKQQLIAALASYARAALACVGALYMSGVTDPKVLANAFIAAALAPLLRAVSPTDKAFGVGTK